MKIRLFCLSLMVCICSYAVHGNTTKKVELNIFNLVRDWGFLSNFHPAITSNLINADSLFDQIAENIINNNATYSRVEILIILNKENPTLTSDDFLPQKIPGKGKRAQKYNSTLKTYNCPVKNPRIAYDDSKEQLLFGDPLPSKQLFPKPSQRISALEKIWNNYRYYYPYQEILGRTKDYNRLLIKYIKILLECENFNEYQLAIRMLTSEYRDTHSFASNYLITNHLGSKTFAAKVRYIQGQAIISAYYDDSVLQKSNLKIGDQIIKINNESISSIFQRLKPLVSYSNSAAMYRKMVDYSTRTNSDSICLLINRSGNTFQTTLPTYSKLDLLDGEEKIKTPEAIKELNDSTLYVSCQYVDTSRLRKILFNNRALRYFVFDLRSTTKWIKPVVNDFFFQKNVTFAKYFKADLYNPGSFSKPKTLSIGPGSPEMLIKDPRVFILVDENTQSQGEFQTMFLQAIPYAITIGSQTAGTDGNISQFRIPGNIIITMTAVGIQYPDDKRSQQNGVKIDYHTQGKQELYQKQIDLELEVAMSLIKNGG